MWASGKLGVYSTSPMETKIFQTFYVDTKISRPAGFSRTPEK